MVRTNMPAEIINIRRHYCLKKEKDLNAQTDAFYVTYNIICLKRKVDFFLTKFGFMFREEKMLAPHFPEGSLTVEIFNLADK